MPDTFTLVALAASVYLMACEAWKDWRWARTFRRDGAL